MNSLRYFDFKFDEKKDILAYWGKIGEKCQKCVVWSKNAKKRQKMAEAPPKFFGGRLGSKVLQKKNATFLPIDGRYLVEIMTKNWVFGDFEKAKFSKFWPKLAEKQHLLKKNFFQFLVRNLAHIHRKFEVHSPKSGGAIWLSVFWCTDRNCIIFGSPCHVNISF